jgi:hypothetical protein
MKVKLITISMLFHSVFVLVLPEITVTSSWASGSGGGCSDSGKRVAKSAMVAMTLTAQRRIGNG